GDDYHSAANIEKMSRGIGLTDADRKPWLAALHALIEDTVQRHEHVVLACSALKHEYRETLAGNYRNAGAVRFVYLDVPADVLARRLASRQHHFAPPALLTSQLATLEQ